MDGFDMAAGGGLAGLGLSADPAVLTEISARLAETAAAYDRCGAFPHENFDLLHCHGTTGLAKPAKTPSLESNFVKHLFINKAIKAAEKAVAVTGNPALSRHDPLKRHYRHTLLGRVHSPQDDTTLTAAGKAALAARG